MVSLSEEEQEPSDQEFDSDDSLNDNDAVNFSEYNTDSEEEEEEDVKPQSFRNDEQENYFYGSKKCFTCCSAESKSSRVSI